MFQRKNNNSEKGSVLLYIFLAIGLLGALTMSFINSDTTDMTADRAAQSAEKLYNQANAIKALVKECTILYPDGGGDLDGDGDIDSDDNANPPYPLSPSNANNPGGAAADNTLQYLKCPGAPSGDELIYQSTKGTFVPDPPAGFDGWYYTNHTVNNTIYIRVNGDGGQATTLALEALARRFGNCEAVVNHGGCGANCIKIFIIRGDAC